MSVIGRSAPFVAGAASGFAFAITANTSNANLRTMAVSAGWNQSDHLVCTVNSGVAISGSSGGYALTISGSFPGGVTLINNGVIYGLGGQGGAPGWAFYNGSGYSTRNADNGGTGGNGLNVTGWSGPFVKVQNNGVIAGAGGGGGGGGGAAGSGSYNAKNGGTGGTGGDYYSAAGGANPGDAWDGTGGGGNSGGGGSAYNGYGANGIDGQGASYTLHGNGGPPGYAVAAGYSSITWINLGTILGNTA